MDWKLFFIAFVTLFIAELGDKTQLSVFTLVSQHQKPLPIFLGASLALVLVTFIGAIFGDYAAKYIPANYMRLAAGLLFLLIGLFVLKDALPPILRQWIKFL